MVWSLESDSNTEIIPGPGACPDLGYLETGLLILVGFCIPCFSLCVCVLLISTDVLHNCYGRQFHHGLCVDTSYYALSPATVCGICHGVSVPLWSVRFLADTCFFPLSLGLRSEGGFLFTLNSQCGILYPVNRSV